MYKYLIIGLGLMFVFGGGYYVDKAGGGIIGNIIMGNITTQDTLTPVNIDDIPGTYICNTASTCKNKYTLILKNDKTIELIRTLNTANTNNSTDNGITSDPTSTTENGTWDLGVQKMLDITIIGNEENIYDVPQKIVIKNVKTTTLSKISYTKSNYKDMVVPIFIKMEDSH